MSDFIKHIYLGLVNRNPKKIEVHYDSRLKSKMELIYSKEENLIMIHGYHLWAGCSGLTIFQNIIDLRSLGLKVEV